MKKLYSIKELRQDTSFPYKSENAIRSLIKTGRLDVVRFSSHRIMITGESVERYLNGPKK